jgi:GDP-L-fucose synthase
MNTFWRNRTVVVTGGGGFLGRHVVRVLQEQGCRRVFVPRRRSLNGNVGYDLTDENAVRRLFDDAEPDVVLHLAGEVGGIGANRDNPGRFFYANMAMGLHLIEHARRNGVEKFVQVGTICSYPRDTPVPFREDDLWNGYPEETNAPYGIAKKALGVMLDGYRKQYGMSGIQLLPVNLYGPHDNFDEYSSHVIPALIRKCVDARDAGASEIVCWGTGTVSREFLFVEDAARAVVLAAERYDDPEPMNLGRGEEITIADLVARIADHCGYTGAVRWDRSKPDGQPRRCLDTTRARERIGWSAGTSLDEGLRRTIDWWLATTSQPLAA